MVTNIGTRNILGWLPELCVVPCSTRGCVEIFIQFQGSSKNPFPLKNFILINLTLVEMDFLFHLYVIYVYIKNLILLFLQI